MVSLLKRMRRMKSRLLDIRVGLGAAVLPPAPSSSSASPVTRLHLTYARKMYEGHFGARKFWRQCLPRLKYYNPGISMSVKQTDDNAGPALLSLYFENKDGATKQASSTRDESAPSPTESEYVRTIDVKGKSLEEIWTSFKNLTGAEELQVSEADQHEIEERTRQLQQSAIDRQRVASIRQTRKDQAALLAAAKADIERVRAE
ncbi:hypothetical protein LOZ53_000961 [Ophidiomyces ophidiicola]|nr:hypothetical protein LOZ56_005225 [Ophidiomyces ophidiicola]KAI1973707.1 hypothetical protein LOZ55_005280 [Ophidiomyces ophidiicola]KAI1984831.1 hypothetical protein LOZ54_004394 [Ophidiomyces ophidiicola]KAI1996601.1 hypothetical protein LOZ53_000961 [Ophidiomyces ophidiicola]KAI1996836.1 hypothetical protein LOZ51_002998 [Ophidiomyces ophidiicola]